MEIALLPSDLREGVTTHQELDPTNMLSLIASLTPFSDYNQSPRNMYQCQMGKQTMGTPVTSYPHRVDNKMYRILFPQVHTHRDQALPPSLTSQASVDLTCFRVHSLCACLQAPLVQTRRHREFAMDEFPQVLRTAVRHRRDDKQQR